MASSTAEFGEISLFRNETRNEKAENAKLARARSQDLKGTVNISQMPPPSKHHRRVENQTLRVSLRSRALYSEK
jgi:hypothetical protein